MSEIVRMGRFGEVIDHQRGVQSPQSDISSSVQTVSEAIPEVYDPSDDIKTHHTAMLEILDMHIAMAITNRDGSPEVDGKPEYGLVVSEFQDYRMDAFGSYYDDGPEDVEDVLPNVPEGTQNRELARRPGRKKKLDTPSAV